MSTPQQRLRMAETIKNYEARRNPRTHELEVYNLPKGDGGGRYEVAGINEHFNKVVCDQLVALVNAGRFAEAEALASEFIATDTDPVAAWSRIPAIEFYLRDSCFNRGAKGAATIVQIALGVAVDGQIGADTRAALAQADNDPAALLSALRAARETYERNTYPWKKHARDESSKFWKGLVNRWNNALAAARTFPLAASGGPAPLPEPAPAPSPQPSPAPPLPAAFRILRRGLRGADVTAWQSFLHDQGFDPGPLDGIFGSRTAAATVAFQEKYVLKVDGIAGPETFLQASKLGFKAASIPPPDVPAPEQKPAPAKPSPAKTPAKTPTKTPGDLAYPARPTFGPLVSTKEREKLFEQFDYVAAPTREEPRAIRILGTWERDNIVSVPIPQLRKTALGARAPQTIQFHKRAAAQLQGLWADWEAANLLDRILTYEGSFNARFIGKTTTLSNHAFGSAFDINVEFNPWHHPAAKPGEKGCVYELVPIANRWGFFWGGHFSANSIDGMHFEVALLKS